MKVNTLMMDQKDNVGTCICDVSAGEKVSFICDGEKLEVKALENIPYCHKVAIKPIEKGAEVIKYGEVIGASDVDICVGQWVSHHNIHGIPRDYISELL
jgi:altronate dehydratase